MFTFHIGSHDFIASFPPWRYNDLAMGRKKLPLGQVREKPLRIRLNAEERRLVDEAARRKGYGSTSKWVREELLRLAGQALEKDTKAETTAFPVYFLQLGDEWQVAIPDDREDIGHTDFWEQAVANTVAKHYGIPEKQLANLPYSQRRARIVGDKVFYGEKPDQELLRLLREAVGNDRLVFVHDDHEKRLREDVLAFRRLMRHYRPKSTT
jgi:hypothetical protein